MKGGQYEAIVPTMKDRAMQALYLLALSPVAETTGEGRSHGFRPNRSAADAIGRSFALLSQRRSPQWVLEGDIESCFDRINHDWLPAHVPMETRVLRMWLKAGFMDGSTLYPTDDGTPQGGIISPVLANIALDGLEELLRKRFPRRHRHMVNMVRYADDFIITGATREVLTDEVRPLIERFLSERGLQLSPTKTVVTHVDVGFDFLGQNLRKFRGVLLTTPARRSVHALLTRVREVIRTSPAVPASVVVMKLNPIIRGWANFHRHAVSSRRFSFVDHQIWKALWRWARRRHPSRGCLWVRRKYFPRHGSRTWVFTGMHLTRYGTREPLRIFHAADVHIRRHLVIRGDANPFDPTWDDYFRRRRRSSVVKPRSRRRAFAEA